MSTEDETLLEASLAKDHLKEKAKEKFSKLEKLGGSVVNTENLKSVANKVIHASAQQIYSILSSTPKTTTNMLF
jgi:hypothetical protein